MQVNSSNGYTYVPKDKVEHEDKSFYTTNGGEKTEYKTEQLKSANDASMIKVNRGRVDLSNLPSENDNSNFQFADPNSIDGEMIEEVKNKDGTVTRTYKNADNTITKVTGKKSGLFGLGNKIKTNSYDIEEYSANGQLLSTTSKNAYGIETTLYDEDGNKDISLGLYSSSNKAIKFFNNDGLLYGNNAIFTVTDYNPNGTSFTEELGAGNSTIMDARDSYLWQYFKDENGNGITREEYLEKNGFEQQ